LPIWKGQGKGRKRFGQKGRGFGKGSLGKGKGRKVGTSKNPIPVKVSQNGRKEPSLIPNLV